MTSRIHSRETRTEGPDSQTPGRVENGFSHAQVQESRGKFLSSPTEKYPSLG